MDRLGGVHPGIRNRHRQGLAGSRDDPGRSFLSEPMMSASDLPSPTLRDTLLRLLRSAADGNLAGTIGELRVAAVLDDIGIETLHDVYLPDGRDGRRWTQIDHLVLNAAGILVVETKNYGGRVYAGQFDRTWTHWIGGQKHKPQNPIRQNKLHVRVVQDLVPGVQVLERVVFTDRVKFGKDLPEGVSMLRDLRRDLGEKLGIGAGVPSGELLSAWAAVKARVERSPEVRRQHLEDIQARFGTSEATEPQIGIDAVLDAVDGALNPARRRPALPPIRAERRPERQGRRPRRGFSWARLAIPLIGLALLFVVAPMLPKFFGALLPRILAPTTVARPHASAVASMPAATSPTVSAPDGPGWIPLRPVDPAPVQPVAPIRPAPPPPRTAPVQSGQPTYAVRMEPPPTPQESASQACNTAIAALLIDNGPENRAAKEVACGKAPRGAAGRP
jgi:restriction system protein